MQKTLLDEFAMAAMLGWLSSRNDPSVLINQEAAAASFYDMAEAMMAEREKRLPQPAIDPDKEKLAQEISERSGLVASMPNSFICPPALREAINSMKGRKATCSEICEKAYGLKGDMSTLRGIGDALRGMGFQKVRSGGKDYYQL